MECPKCRFDNPDELRFCGNCGTALAKTCPKCRFSNPPLFNYCGHCGYDFRGASSGEPPAYDGGNAGSVSDPAISGRHVIESARKIVTVLFSDLSGYTAMSEHLDPEEIKDIMHRLFGEITRVVAGYEGYIDKFIGDAVMVVFGVPKAHEDDPFRAVMAAREIHERVAAINEELHEKIGRPITMHTGIDTGLVITGEMDTTTGEHGMTGDAINIASRLTDRAEGGEILVGSETYRQCREYFEFEQREPARVKGKSEPIDIYRVLSVRTNPQKVRRSSGLKARLIGRDVEMRTLNEALISLREGGGAVFSICGDAGTGKSRLVEEFRHTVDRGTVQWFEGHAYPYTKNIPYYPFINLLSRICGIEEGDAKEKLQEKIERRLADITADSAGILPFIGSLFSIDYPGLAEMSPEYWKTRLHQAVSAVVSGLSEREPVIICLEDLHWIDPSSQELLRTMMTDTCRRVMLLCVHRPSFTLFTHHPSAESQGVCHEIRISELSLPEAQDMVESLLGTKNVPARLRKFIHRKAEGNPYYLEEMVNSLVDAEILVHDHTSWTLQKPITEAGIPSTLRGVIEARLDRLENETKRILEEAAVIGRVFNADILKRITRYSYSIDQCLGDLKRLDLIQVRSARPEMEYVFKHALNHEVVYKGLLKKEREIIHLRIACVMEELYRDRLSEFYEILAYHFSRGGSLLRAVHYLILSAEKSFGRYSLDEAHQYFSDAFILLSRKVGKTKEEKELLVDVLNRWATVFNQEGDYGQLIDILTGHTGLVESLDNTEHKGMFYGWLGWALRQREHLTEAYDYLCRALTYGEESGSDRVVGYVCAWLTQTCSDLGCLDEAIRYGRRARGMTELLNKDQLFFQFSMFGMGLAHYFRGESREEKEIGTTLLEYGHNQADIRSVAMGQNMIGLALMTEGDFSEAIGHFQKSIDVSLDPMILCLSKFFLGMTYLFEGRLEDAEQMFDGVLAFNNDFGLEAIGTSAQALMSIVAIIKGNLRGGIKGAHRTMNTLKDIGSKYRYASVAHLLGRVYLNITKKKGRRKPLFMLKNFGFLLQTLPFAARKAEAHLAEAIAVADEIGAKGLLGLAKLDFGLLHQAKGRIDDARTCILEAAVTFKQCGAVRHYEQAQEILATLQ